MNLFLDRLESPIGTLLIVTDGQAVRALDFLDFEPRMQRLLKLHYGSQPLRENPEKLGIKKRLQEYFAGNLTSINEISVRTESSPFQQLVWAELRKIPAGATVSYGELAKRIGSPSASRAVGLANGSNPIAVIVPCHRVIGSTGALTGYGGGIERKRWLLNHEAAYA
jgi:methylated-DNA-[protein]-cysteine S-methyltransferase